MGYKHIDTNLIFAEISLMRSMEHNHSLRMMEKINAIIDWSKMEALLLKQYAIGKSAEEADVYHPLILLKCMLLQQWFHIDPDSDLENQINDRISVKKFLGISFDQASPDRSTFCRFRSRLSKAAMNEIIHEVLSVLSKECNHQRGCCH